MGLEEEHEDIDVSRSKGWVPAPGFGASQSSLLFIASGSIVLMCPNLLLYVLGC